MNDPLEIWLFIEESKSHIILFLIVPNVVSYSVDQNGIQIDKSSKECMNHNFVMAKVLE